MDVKEIIESAGDVMTVKRVFGDPYEKNGVTVLPAARIQGGAGGGGGEGPEGEGHGEGSGFGMTAKPAGAYVIKGESVRWQPAVDVNRIILGAQVVAIFALLIARAVSRARMDRDTPKSKRPFGRSARRARRSVRPSTG